MMKNPNPRSILAVLLLAAVCLFAACGTPAQNVATAHFLAGNAFARYELAKSPANVKGLDDLAAALPDMASGKITPFEMGVLNAELQAINQSAADPALADNSSALTRIGSIISAGIQSNAANSGGRETYVTAVIGANLTDFSLGIKHGVEFWRGQQSVRPAARVNARESMPGYTLR